MKAYKIILLFFIVTISSYAQVTVHLQQPPPYQFKVEQFWKIVLINNSERAVNVYLKGIATESSQGKIIEATSSVISLQPGARTVNGRDLGPFTVSESNTRYKNIIMNTGSLPSGRYDICVAVFQAVDGMQIASDCIQTTVENLNRMELISPLDQEVIGNIFAEESENQKLKNMSGPPIIIFSWLPPVPVPPNARISYRLKLVEILGYQSVHSAMASNPLYYQSLMISSTVLRYPVAARQLVPGKRYAWEIECFLDDFKTQESEIRSFEIQGGEAKKEKYSANYNGDTNQYGETYINEKSGLPSGLSSFTNTNKNYGTSILNFFGAPAQIDLFGSPSNFKFYGDAKLTQITSSKPAQFSQLPLNYWTFEINPRLSIYDIPFGMNIYLSSLNNSNRQSLNSVSFMLDIDRLKSKIKDRISEKVKEIASSVDSTLGKLTDIAALSDPNKLEENAEKLGLISPAEKLFLNIKTLGIGRTYPDYSELTVSGVPVNGLNVEFNPGILYFAVAAGNNFEGIDNVSFKRSFLAGRIGLGEKENAHFFLTALKMKDDLNSILVSSLNPLLPPQENVVLGSEGKLNLFQKLIEINGEAAVSAFTRDLNDADFVSSSIPGFVKNLLTPKLSTSFDYAWKGKIAFNNEPSATFFSLGVRRIGPGFMSLAAPSLRQDQLQFDFNFDQKFADKKITMKTFFKVYNDNLINWKQSTTTTTSFGINLGFYFPNLPFVQINYSPYSQSNDNIIATQKMENTSDLFSLMTGYSYRLSSVSASTTLSFTGQWQNNKIGIISNKFSNESYMLNQNFSFEFPLTVSSTLSLAQSNILSISSSITEFDLNGNYQLSEMISTNLGGTISNEENYTKKIMIYLGSNIILYQWLRFELQGNISNFKDLSGGGNNYNDAMLQATVSMNW
ncbi:MAG: hypothetical protein D4R68_08055 [Ignavibacteriales bacterium]|nr:MAG: hypothetical protein D4R68_08055 [Ignavibacteriales bacterium]